jgi:hypothetical protein
MPFFPAALASLFTALKRHITLALFAVALIASALLIHSWLDARRAAAQLAATIAAQQKIISDADARQSARDAALTQTLAQIDALKRRVQTPQQASDALAQSLPQFIASSLSSNGASGGAGNASGIATLPAPLQIIPFGSPNNSPAAPLQSSSPNSSAPCTPGSPNPGPSTACPPATTSSNSAAPPLASSNSPNANSPAAGNAGFLSSLKSQISNLQSGHPVSSSTVPIAQQGTASSQSNNPSQQGTTVPPIPGSICIPPADLKPLFDSIENCEACAAQLTAVQTDLTDERAKFAAATTQRDAALRAVHGTFWTRTARAAKWIAIGAAAGAVIARYH